MFKKIIVILLSTLMILSLTSCGVRQSLDEKITEKVTEGVINKATGGEANIDIDKGQLTVKGKDGEQISFGNNKWPEGGAANLIPEYKKGNIVSAINSDKACVIAAEQVEDKDFKQYVEELKARGFTIDAAEYTSDLGQGYSANLDEKTRVSVLYDPENKGLTISLETSQ